MLNKDTDLEAVLSVLNAFEAPIFGILFSKSTAIPKGSVRDKLEMFSKIP